jgi:hypothetical protein
MGDENDGFSRCREFPDLKQQVLQTCPVHRIERPEGLIHQQQGRTEGECAGNRGALAHAPRQLAGIFADGGFQPQIA